MRKRNVIDFLRTAAARAEVLESLKIKSKREVIEAATAFGFPFSEADFDSLIWDLEAYLAKKRGERFDANFPLWQTMWGKYYLEYLVIDMIPSFEEADFEAVLTARAGSR